MLVPRVLVQHQRVLLRRPAKVLQSLELQRLLAAGPGSSCPRAAVRQMDLSARAYHRVLKLARTIADLAREERVLTQHLAEALQYRPRALA